MLDGAFTPENKQRCAEASRPLIEAVEKLTTYGSSPEFASIPARISKEVLPIALLVLMMFCNVCNRCLWFQSYHRANWWWC